MIYNKKINLDPRAVSLLVRVPIDFGKKTGQRNDDLVIKIPKKLDFKSVAYPTLLESK